MDAGQLPFDADEMLAGLRSWVECESPTFDAGAVNRMMELAARHLAGMEARIEVIPGQKGFGNCVRARFPHPREGEPGVLVIGHLDSVHPVGTLARLPWKRKGDLCYGPAIFDMKGGNYLAMEAMAQLCRATLTTPLPVTFLLTSDEEVGTPANRGLIEKEAIANKYSLVPEPARQNGDLVSGRYAIARFNLEARGKPSHAGATLKAGRSAIREMARRILAIEDMTGEDCTFSVGVIHGGQWVNCVPSLCRGEVLSMAKRQADLDAGVERMLALSSSGDDVTFAVTRGVTRPVWEPNEATLDLVEKARGVARSLGLDISHMSAGGGSDGNFTGALGLPTLDGLGVMGDGAHTLNEHIQVSSLAERGKLMAGLLLILE